MPFLKHTEAEAGEDATPMATEGALEMPLESDSEGAITQESRAKKSSLTRSKKIGRGRQSEEQDMTAGADCAVGTAPWVHGSRVLQPQYLRPVLCEGNQYLRHDSRCRL
jgi:hypothetical protein